MRKEVDVRKLVRYQPLFQELNDAQIEALMPSIREVRIEKGRDLFHREDPCDGLWLVVYGRVKLFITSPQGNEKVIEIMQAGQSFGEAVMFLRRPYPVSAHVLEDSMLLHVSESAISNAIETDKSFARHLLAGLSMRLHTFVQDVERYSMENPLQRVAGYLVQLSETPEADAFTVSLPVNKNLIASRLSLAPETFSRVLNQLSAAGFIEVDGKDITVNNPSGMLLFAQTSGKTKS